MIKTGNKIQLIWLTLVVSALPMRLCGQRADMAFNRVNLPELARFSVLYTLQDERGFIWLGATDGVYRYDGNGVKAFLPEPNNPESLSAPHANILFLDSRGYLWIGTQAGGLNRLDRRTGKIRRYLYANNDPNSLSNNNIFDIIEDCNGNIWVATNGGGACAIRPEDQERGYFYRFRSQSNNPNSLGSDLIWALSLDDAGQLWLGGSNLMVAQANQTHRLSETRFIIHHLGEESGSGMITTQSIYYLVSDGEDGMWAASGAGNLYRFRPNPPHARFTISKKIPVTTGNGAGGNINWVAQHPNGSIWLATDLGIDILTDEKVVPGYRHDPGRASSLPPGSINMISFDQWGTLWVSTSSGKLATGIPKAPFHYYSHKNFPEFSGQWVRSILEDSQERLWVGTWNTGGLFHIEPHTGRILKAYKHTDKRPHNLLSSNITRIFEDSKGRLWLALYNGGLALFDDKAETFTPYGPDLAQGRSALFAQSIIESKEGFLWVGAETGLYKFYPEGNRWQGFFANPGQPGTLSDNRVQSNALLEDPDGVLWAGVWEGGLNRYDPATGKFEHWRHDPNNPNSLGSDGVLAVVRDDRQTLWIGTFGGGLSRVVRTDAEGRPATFKTYTSRDGLVSNIIYSIVPDQQGFLWLGTDKGICRFDPVKEIFQVFDESNGLDAEECYFGASATRRHGAIALGGVGGFHYFHPDSIQVNYQPPSVYVTGVKVFNKDYPGQEDMPYVREIRLPHTADFFSIQFAALNYFQPEKNQFAYRLEGFDHDWVYCGADNKATYTNLNAGTYTFRVKAANNNGIWNETGAGLRVIIEPAFWETRAFIASIILAVFVFFYLSVWRATRKEVEARKNLEEMVIHSTQKMTITGQSVRPSASRADIALALRESEAFFKSMYESGPLGILSIDSRGGLLRANEQFYKQTGLSPGEILHQSVKSFVHPDDWAAVKQIFIDAIEQQLQVIHYEHRVNNKTDTVKWASIVASLIYDQQGRHLYSICIAADITDTKQKTVLIEELAARLKDQNEELEARVAARTAALTQANTALSISNEELERFTYITSHDIKEPLRNIASFVSLIRRKMGPQLTDDMLSYFSYVDTSVKQLYTLIEDLRT